MNRFEYPVLLTPDQDGGFVVTSRDLPEVITQGETIENALFEAADALDEAFAARIDDGLAIPPPSPLQVGEYWVGPPVETAIKAGLYLALRESRISKSELARRLGVNEKAVRRMLDPHYVSKLPRMVEAIQALGKRLVIAVE